jgi:Protein of unknown function (DUF2690)
MSRLRRSLLGFVLSLTVVGIFATQGYAYLGQYAHDNTSPTAGCATNDYRTWPGASKSLNMQYGGLVTGLLELRYSSVCQTAWARFTCQSNSAWACTNICVNVNRGNDGAWATNYQCVTPLEHMANGAQIWSYQVNDAGSLYSSACVSLWTDQSWWAIPSGRPNKYCTGTY